MQTSTLIGTKNFGFFEIYGVFARTRGGWASADIFRTMGNGGQFFAILCGRPLWTAPNYLLSQSYVKNFDNFILS